MKEYWSLWQESGLDLPQALLEMPLPSLMPLVSARAVEESPKDLSQLRAELGDCQRCSLAQSRRHLMFGYGSPSTNLVFVASAPDEPADGTGLHYSGRAGGLLEKMIEAMGRSKDDVYLTSVVKCRPAQDRLPKNEELAECSPFLRAQIDSISPLVVVALGDGAAHALLKSPGSVSELRGRFHSLAWNPNISVMPTFDPDYLLRNASAKREVWEDLKQVIGFLKGD